MGIGKRWKKSSAAVGKDPTASLSTTPDAINFYQRAKNVYLGGFL